MGFTGAHFKGIVPQKNFYRPNPIFWVVMGLVELVSVGRAKKPPKIENFGLKVCSLGSQGDPHKRARGNPQWELKATCTELRVTRDRSSGQPAIGYVELLMPLELLLRVASSSVWVASSSHRGLPRALIVGCLKLLCAGRLEIPGNKIWDKNFQF